MKAILLTVLTILTISFTVAAQPPVDVWQVQTPSNPMNCTNTTVTITGWNDAGNYTLQAITISYGNDTIWVDIKYTSPQIILGVLTSWSHTVSLGNVPYGNWTVAARGYLDNNWESEAYGWLPVGACCPSSIPQFDFVEDTVCAGSPITVTNNSIGNNLSYLWEFEGGTSTLASPTFSITESGTYDVTLTVTGDSCSDSLVKEIEILELPEADLGNDTNICDGDTLIVSVPAGNDYVWNDGSTSYQNSIATAGQLSVTVTDGQGCVASDTIAVLGVLPTISVNLGSDKLVCPDESVVLNAGTGGTAYVWSTGESTQSITTAEQGLFAVTVSESGYCDGVDEVEIDWLDVDQVNILMSMDSCASRSITVDQSTHDVVSWSDGSSDTNMVATLSGVYYVTATDVNGCQSEDSANVIVVDLPQFDLGADTFLCGDQTITLVTGISGTYLWSDGSTSSVFTVTEKGKYSVSVTDANGCTGADTIKVDHCLGLNSFETNELVVYPNPVMDILYVNADFNTKFTVYSLTGNLVKTGILENGIISLGSLPKGMYVIEIGNTEKSKAVISKL